MEDAKEITQQKQQHPEKPCTDPECVLGPSSWDPSYSVGKGMWERPQKAHQKGLAEPGLAKRLEWCVKNADLIP